MAFAFGEEIKATRQDEKIKNKRVGAISGSVAVFFFRHAYAGHGIHPYQTHTEIMSSLSSYFFFFLKPSKLV